jgi:hypothetical protein
MENTVWVGLHVPSNSVYRLICHDATMTYFLSGGSQQYFWEINKFKIFGQLFL